MYSMSFNECRKSEMFDFCFRCSELFTFVSQHPACTRQIMSAKTRLNPFICVNFASLWTTSRLDLETLGTLCDKRLVGCEQVGLVKRLLKAIRSCFS